MWHILKKLPEKVGPVICKDTEFLKKINRCAWSEDVEPPEFEERWTTVVESHGLSDNEWLKEKYNIRNMWVPPYFRVLFLGGLMRTTSRSESENHFFSNFTNPNLTLVEFWMRFESAMDAQRWTHSNFLHNKKLLPRLSTPLALEKHASEIYTPTMFGEFQKEVEAACYSCGVGDKEKDKTYPILYTDIIDQVRNKTYKVGFKKDDVSMSVEQTSNPPDQSSALMARVLHFDELLGILREFKERVKITPDESGNTGIAKVKDKNAEIGMLLGTNIPSEIKVLPPRQCKNKGSGKRLISQRERAGEVTKKALRKCRACGEMANHDSRNCDRRTTDNE
ncbi:protein FAR-RED ELONGATED HYPOCOTYL 3-like [Silene latifolia]|uniref:protein FAR-RED ELONGATED HYPOCOTYL 3-like n=1 Tax=Silene latifolia TaxID=37657 RepID=UPI003D77B7F3